MRKPHVTQKSDSFDTIFSKNGPKFAPVEKFNEILFYIIDENKCPEITLFFL